ncbi:hypothetical protein [Trinickia sp.]|uniref:hypothetical protein n=1 Tax=Trinickia sp. TaxID=2571163 RepID=UPI003F7F49DB
MATPVRSLLIGLSKALLFVVLFVFSMRFVHTYPLPMPPDQQQKLFLISQELEIRDPDDLYLSAVAIVNLIVASMEYVLIAKIWIWIKVKWGVR